MSKLFEKLILKHLKPIINEKHLVPTVMISAGLINKQQILWTNLLVTPYQYGICHTTNY
jgi:hypothetical protein